ncbi:hypothetical protein D3C74_213470 [compost metagenome]
MAFLKDSPKKEEIRERYEELWSELLVRDEEESEKVLEKAWSELSVRDEGEPDKEDLEELDYNSVPTIRKILRPFKTHLTWIIPLSVITFFVLAYVIFIYIALWVED